MQKLFVVVLAVTQAQSAAPTASAIITRYVQALGGEPAIRAVKTRVSEGEYDNGRGLNTRYKIIEGSPNKRVTMIGVDPVESAMGSGRGFDGVSGWDKNFVGTGLRSLEGRELTDVAREANMLRPLQLLDDCKSTVVESRADSAAVLCNNQTGNRVTFVFDKKTGLLTRQEVAGARSITIHYTDYRLVDGMSVPFKTRIEVPGATLQYHAQTITHNQSVDPKVFQRPVS